MPEYSLQGEVVTPEDTLARHVNIYSDHPNLPDWNVPVGWRPDLLCRIVVRLGKPNVMCQQGISKAQHGVLPPVLPEEIPNTAYLDLARRLIAEAVASLSAASQERVPLQTPKTEGDEAAAEATETQPDAGSDEESS